MIVVSDTSPISNLITVGKLNLLRKVFKNIVIPVKVREVIDKLKNFDINLSEFNNSEWIQVKDVDNKNLVKTLQLVVDKGESEAIALALELNADFILIDERKGRMVAEKLGIKAV